MPGIRHRQAFSVLVSALLIGTIVFVFSLPGASNASALTDIAGNVILFFIIIFGLFLDRDEAFPGDLRVSMRRGSWKRERAVRICRDVRKALASHFQVFVLDCLVSVAVSCSLVQLSSNDPPFLIFVTLVDLVNDLDELRNLSADQLTWNPITGQAYLHGERALP